MADERFRALRRRLYLLSFLDELTPLYPLYALLFADNGLSAGEISVGVAAFSLTSLIVEVPSGALADRMSRRRLLAIATALQAPAIALLLIWPSFTGVVAGMVLWGIAISMSSGTYEALVYDELERLGHADDYARVQARNGQFNNLGIALAGLTAAPLVELVGIRGVGWISAAITLVAAAVTLRLPEAPAAEREWEGLGAWWETLKEGVTAAARVPVLGRLVLLGGLAEGVFFVDEYLPLLARERGAGDGVVPLLVLVAWLGLMAGGELVARRPELSNAAMGLVGVAGVLGLVVALQPGPAAGIGAMALLYASLQATWVLADARLQEHARSETRATLTSVRELGVALVELAGFAAIGLLAGPLGLGRATLWSTLLPAALVALLVARWLPRPRSPAPGLPPQGSISPPAGPG